MISLKRIVFIVVPFVLAVSVYSAASIRGKTEPIPRSGSLSHLEVTFWFDAGEHTSSVGIPQGVYVCTGDAQFRPSATGSTGGLACAACETQDYPYCNGDCPPPDPGQVLVGCIGFGLPPGDIGWCYCMYIRQSQHGGVDVPVLEFGPGDSVLVLEVTDPDAIQAIGKASPQQPVVVVVGAG